MVPDLIFLVAAHCNKRQSGRKRAALIIVHGSIGFLQLIAGWACAPYPAAVFPCAAAGVVVVVGCGGCPDGSAPVSG